MSQIMEFLLSGFTDDSGEPLALGKVFTYESGTTDPKDTFDADDNVLPNPLILDASGRLQAYGDGNYTLVIKTFADETLYTFDNVFFGNDIALTGLGGAELLNIGEATELTSAAQYGQLVAGKPHFVTAVSGDGDNITLTPDPGPQASAAGQYWIFIAPGANTGASQANVGGTGAQAIKKVTSTGVKIDLDPNDILEDNLYLIGNDGTDYILLNPNLTPTPAGTSKINYAGTSTGAANAQEVTLSPVITALVTGISIRYTAGFTNTGAMTLKADGTAATALVTGNGMAMEPGAVVAGQEYEAFYDGTSWVHIELTQARILARDPDGTSFSNTTTETSLFSSTIKANSLANGRALRFRAFGRINNGAGYPIIGSFRIKFGGAEKLNIGFVAPATDTGYFDMEVIVTSGTASACKVAGRVGITYLTATSPYQAVLNANTYTEDFTIDRDFELTGQIVSAPTPGIGIDCYSSILEYL